MTDNIQEEKAFYGDQDSGCPNLQGDWMYMPAKLPEFCRNDALIRIASYTPSTPVIPVPNPIPPRPCPCPKSSNPRVTFLKSDDCCDWTIVTPDPKICVPRIEYNEDTGSPGELKIQDRCDGVDYDFTNCCPVYTISYKHPNCSGGYTISAGNKNDTNTSEYNFKIPLELIKESGGPCNADIRLDFNPGGGGGGGGGGGVPCPHVKIKGDVKVNGKKRGTITQVIWDDEDEEETDTKVKVNNNNQCEQKLRLKIDMTDLFTSACEGNPFGAKLEFHDDEAHTDHRDAYWTLSMTEGYVYGPFPGMKASFTLSSLENPPGCINNGVAKWYAYRNSDEFCLKNTLFWLDYDIDHTWKLKCTQLSSDGAIDPTLLRDDLIGGAILLFKVTGTNTEPKIEQIRCENVTVGNLNTWASWHAEAYGSSRHGYDILMATGRAYLTGGGKNLEKNDFKLDEIEGKFIRVSDGASHRQIDEGVANHDAGSTFYVSILWNEDDGWFMSFSSSETSNNRDPIKINLWKFADNAIIQYTEGDILRVFYSTNAAFSAVALASGRNNSSFTVKMLGGTAQGMFGAMKQYKTQTWSNITNGTCFWVKCNDNGVFDDQIKSGSDFPSTGDSQTQYFACIPLFKVEHGAPNNIIQYHQGSIYIPTVTNVIEVQ